MQSLGALLLLECNSAGTGVDHTVMTNVSFYTASAQPTQILCLSYGKGVRLTVCLSVCLRLIWCQNKRRKLESRNFLYQLFERLVFSSLLLLL